MLAARRALLAATTIWAPVIAPPAALATPAIPAGITVPAPPARLTQVRAAEMPALDAIDVPAAWRVTMGKGILVAVLDTGVDSTVPDLAGQVTLGPDYLHGVDPSGYQLPLDHGTYIASLIAGHGRGPGDDLGVIGVAPRARILSVRVIPDDSEPGLAAYNKKPRYANAIADGVYYAVQHRARVINMSLGSQQPTGGLRAAIAYAISRGVVVVASAGNNGTPRAFAPYVYPASFTGVIAVAALNPDGVRAAFSEQNSSVVISAPGVDVIGTGPATSTSTRPGPARPPPSSAVSPHWSCRSIPACPRRWWSRRSSAPPAISRRAATASMPASARWTPPPRSKPPPRWPSRPGRPPA